MRHSRGRAPVRGPHARFGGMSRKPMAWQGRFGMHRPPMASHGRFGMHRPSAPWQGRSRSMLRGRGGAHGAPHAGMVSARLKHADENKDGKISKSEAPEMLKQHFARVDADKDGQLDRAELAKAAAAVRGQFAARGDVDKRREALKQRIEAARKAHGHAGRPEAKKPVADKDAVKKPAPKKAAEKKPAEKKPEAKKPVEKKPEAKKPEAKK